MDTTSAPQPVHLASVDWEALLRANSPAGVAMIRHQALVAAIHRSNIGLRAQGKSCAGGRKHERAAQRRPRRWSVLKAVASKYEAARSPVVASWRRSASFSALRSRFDEPTSPAAVRQVRRCAPTPRLAVAGRQGSLDRLFLAVGGVGCSVLLADRERRRGRSAGRGLRRLDVRRLGLVDRRGVEREVSRARTASAPASSSSAP